MLLKKILLQNYRNYVDAGLECTPTLNVIWGNNGQGKSNLLEAVYLLSTGQSFRANRDQELINWEKNFFLVKAEVATSQENLQIDISYPVNNKKVLKINGYKRSKISDILGIFNVVLFSPDELYLVKGGPNQRRRYLDLTISRLHPAYYYHLQQYQKALDQRNQLLRNLPVNPRLDETLEVWDQQLVDLGSKILFKRLKILPGLTRLAGQFYGKIAANTERMTISYQSSVNLPAPEPDKNYSEAAIADSFARQLRQIRKEEARRGMTLIGPHRDDLIIYLNDREMRSFGSQGQQRSAALSLKLAELEILSVEQGDYPVLLLDDVLSELDGSRREFLFTQLKDRVQTFLTTTQHNYLSQDLLAGAGLIEVKNGVLCPN